MPLEIVDMHFDCAGSQNLGGGGECLSRLRSRCGAVRTFAHGGHFAWQAQGKPHGLVVQSSMSTFRDRRKGFERLYFEMQISWQV